MADDRTDVAGVLRSTRRPAPWLIALGIAVLIAARWAASGTPSVRMIAGGLLTVAVPAIVVGACLERGRPLLAAAVVLACCSTVVAASADGRWQGVVALAMVALAAWSERKEAAATLALVSVVAVVLWWRSGFDRGDAPGPSWREVAGETGSIVRRATSSVGTGELIVPLSGVLVWWLGVGVVVGAALAAGRVGRSAWVPVSLAVLVAGVWAIQLWRGSVDPIAATWIVATGIVLAAGRPGERTHDVDAESGEARMAALVMAIAGVVMAIAFVSEMRSESTVGTVAAGVGGALVGVSLSAPLAVRWVSGRVDA